MSNQPLALLGGQPVACGHDFPKDRVAVGEYDSAAVTSVINSGEWSMFTSQEVGKFERSLADYVGAVDSVFVTSGTAAIHCALLALDLPPRPKVAVPAFTYVGTVTPVVAIGGRPMLIDIEPGTLGMSDQALKAEVAVSGRPDAVILVHLFGTLADFSRIAHTCRELEIPLVHDCAQLFGSTEATTRLLESGPVCFSFGESKILRIGEGGAVATNSTDFADRLRMARHQGEAWPGDSLARSTGLERSALDVLELASHSPGLNYRPSPFGAALGSLRLRSVAADLEARKNNAAGLLSAVEESTFLEPAIGPPEVWWTLPVQVVNGLARNVALAALLAEGVPVGVHFPKILSEHGVVSSCGKQNISFPVAQAFAERHLVLPIYPELNSVGIQLICDAIRRVDEGLGELDEESASNAAAAFLRTRTVSELCQGLFIFLDDERT